MPRLDTYRRALLEEIGGGGVYTTTGVGTATTLLCSTAFLSTELPNSHLAYAWVYVPSATFPKQRRVKKDGLDQTSGTITVDGTFNGAIASGVEFEISTRLPLIDSAAKSPGISLNQCVNLGLRHLLVPGSRISVTTVANQQSYSLSAYAAWLDSDERIVAVYDPPRAAGFPRPLTRLRWQLNLDDGTPMLEFIDRAYPASGFTFELAVLRPGDSLVNGAESAAGLVNDSDTSPLAVKDVVVAAKVFAYQALARGRNTPKAAEYQELYEQQLALARALPTWDRARDRLGPQPAAEGREAA
jgi:hypothetical protein